MVAVIKLSGLWPTFQSGTVCKSPCSINNLVNELISFPPSVYKVKVLPSPTLTWYEVLGIVTLPW